MPGYRLTQQLTPGHFQAIGELTAQWSFLEWQIEVAIWSLLPTNEINGRVITTQMNIRPKTQIVTLLAKSKLPESRARWIKKFMAEIVTAYGLRNRVVHGLWATDEAGAYQLVWTGGKEDNRANPELIPTTEQQIRGLVDDAVALNNKMNDFRIYLLAREIGIVRPATLP